MRIRKMVVAPMLALSLIAGTAACGAQPASDLRACTQYEDEVLDLDDEGECYAPDDDDKDKKKKKKSIGSTVKSGVDKAKSSTKKSGSTKSTTKSSTRRK